MNFSAEISEWEKDSALSVQKEAFPGLHSLDMRKIRSIQDKTVKSTADVLISREKPSIFAAKLANICKPAANLAGTSEKS